EGAVHAQANTLACVTALQEKAPYVTICHDAKKTVCLIENKRDLDPTRLEPLHRLKNRLVFQHAHLPELRIQDVHITQLPSSRGAEHGLLGKATENVPKNKMPLLNLWSVARRYGKIVVTIIRHGPTPVSSKPNAGQSAGASLVQGEKNV